MNYSITYDHVISLHTYNNVKLPLLARCIYSDLASLVQSGEEVSPSNDQLAAKYGVSTRTIIRAMKALQEAGLVGSTKRKNAPNLYTVLISPADLLVATKVEAATNPTVDEVDGVVVVAPVLEEVTAITAEEFLAQVQETVTSSAEEFLAKMEATPVKAMSAEEFLASMVQVKKEEVTPSVTAEDFLAAMAVSTITAESFLASHTIH